MKFGRLARKKKNDKCFTFFVKNTLKLLQISSRENMILESCFKGFRSITFMNAANSGHMVYVLAEACFWIAFLKKLAKQTNTFVLRNLVFYNHQTLVVFFANS